MFTKLAECIFHSVKLLFDDNSSEPLRSLTKENTLINTLLNTLINSLLNTLSAIKKYMFRIMRL